MIIILTKNDLKNENDIINHGYVLWNNINISNDTIKNSELIIFLKENNSYEILKNKWKTNSSKTLNILNKLNLIKYDN